MPSLKASIDIEAPREHVFAAADPLKMPDWTTHVKEVALTSGDGRSEGTTDTTVIKVGPMRNRLESLWTEFRPGESMSRRFTGYFDGEERITFEPKEGGTHVEWSLEYTPPFGLLGKFGAWFMMARVFQNELEASLEGLRQNLEA